MNDVTQILVAIASDRVFTQFEPLMSRSDLSVMRVRSGQHALTLARNLGFDLIVCQHPLRDLEFEEFHSGLRSDDCAARRAPLLIVTRDDRRQALTESLDDDKARVVCLDRAPEKLDRALSELIGVAVRTGSRLLVETSIDCEGENTHRVFQTSNISESGFLLRSGRVLPVGSRARFALNLPESEKPIRGMAEVVRHTRPEAESLEGMAMRLLRVEGDGRKRLAEFIQRQVPASDG